MRPENDYDTEKKHREKYKGEENMEFMAVISMQFNTIFMAYDYERVREMHLSKSLQKVVLSVKICARNFKP